MMTVKKYAKRIIKKFNKVLGKTRHKISATGKDHKKNVPKNNSKLEEYRKQRVALVREITGWEEEYVKAEMARVKEIGFNQIDYVRYECWKLSDEEILKLVDFRTRITDRRELLKDPVEFVCHKTGWNRQYAEEKMVEAMKLGISYHHYADKEMFDLTDAELVEFAEVLKENTELKVRNRQFYLNIIAQRSGWTVEEARKNVEEAESLGISIFHYTKNACWYRKEEQIKNIGKRTTNREYYFKELYVEKIMEATSWTRGKVELEVYKCKNVCECTHEDYFTFKLFELEPEEQRDYVTFDLFNKMRLKYNDFDKSISVIDNKIEFNRVFSDYINRRWFSNRGLSYEDFLEYIDGLDAVLIKPLNATKGKGIIKINCSDEKDKRVLYEKVINQKESVVEEYIVQHDDVMALCPTSVNTLRIMTLNANGRCNYLCATFRMGRGDIVDNLHAGGITCAVDLKSGITITDAIDLEGNIYTENPYSKVKVKGFKLPYWEKVLETCEEIYDRVDGVNLIGWDFAITSDGIELIEGNPGASYVGAQLLSRQNNIGLRNVMVGDFLE